MSNENKKEGRNIYYISARKDSKTKKKLLWEVKKENCLKVSQTYPTKEEALARAKELGKNQDSTIIIRKLDGSIQETIKYNDN